MYVVIFIIGPVMSIGLLGAIVFAVAGGNLMGELQPYFEHIMLIIECLWLVISLIAAFSALKKSRSANAPGFFLALLCIIAWAIAPSSMYFGSEEISYLLIVGWVLFFIYSFILGICVRNMRCDRSGSTVLHKLIGGTGFSATAIVVASTILFEMDYFQKGSYALNALAGPVALIELIIGFGIYSLLFVLLSMPYYKLAKFDGFGDYMTR